MKLKKGIYYNSIYDSIVEVIAILYDSSSDGIYILYNFGESEYVLNVKNIDMIKSEEVVFLGRV